MDARHWQQCPSSLTHGNIIQRVIFTKKGSENPDPDGAILNCIDSFSRAYLEPGISSVPHINEGIQEMFFVANGAGTFSCGRQKQGIREGDGILIPPGVEHTLHNEGDEPLELLILVESVPEGAEIKNKSALIRNYTQSELGVAHWNYLWRRVFMSHAAFPPDDGLVQLHVVTIVRIEPMRTGDTHGHPADTDEVFYMWKGQGIHVVDKEVIVQTAGTAVSVCPSDPGHSLINHTTEPLMCFYFSHFSD